MSLNCVTKNDPDYERDRQISNARFNLFPKQICYCEDERDVKQAVLMGKGKPIRVRSGGHHHEGMSSGDDVTIIDVSKINAVEVATDKGLSAWAGAGARLRDVYETLWRYRRLLPGGGCGDVCVGGLAQGGGWGPYSRKLGLTCDQIEMFRIVTAAGDIVDVTYDSHPKLFWAVCGGGGGNFGVVTHFRFKVAAIESPITSFTVGWVDRGLTSDVVNEWLERFPNDGDHRMTSFCRLTVLAGGASVDLPIIVAGNFLGEQKEIEAILPRMLPKTYGRATEVDFSRVDVLKPGTRVFTHPEYQPGPPAEAIGGNISSTCDGIPFPHKVSSCYPNDRFNRDAVTLIARYLNGSKKELTARRYLSLHCFGGAIRGDARTKERSCFAFREKPFLLQYQAWWANKGQKDVEDRCIEWVRGFRKELKDYTEGSFINFPDHELDLSSYYGHNFNDLIQVKSEWDREAVFSFPMGIPGLC
jgi:FAD binding domain-containing protein/berberine-like enzyme